MKARTHSLTRTAMACTLVQALAACGGGHSTPTPPASDAMHEAATQLLQSDPASPPPTSSGDDSTGSPTTGRPTTGRPSTGSPTTGGPTTGGPSTGSPTTGGPSTGSPTTGGTSTGDTTPGGTSTGDTTPGGNAKGGPSIEEQNSSPEPYEQDPPTHSTPEDNSVKVPTDASEPTQQINAAVSPWANVYNGEYRQESAAGTHEKTMLTLWVMPDGAIHGYVIGNQGRLVFAGNLDSRTPYLELDLKGFHGDTLGHIKLLFDKSASRSPEVNAVIDYPGVDLPEIVVRPATAAKWSGIGKVEVTAFNLNTPGLPLNQPYSDVKLEVVAPPSHPGTLELQGTADSPMHDGFSSKAIALKAVLTTTKVPGLYEAEVHVETRQGDVISTGILHGVHCYALLWSLKPATRPILVLTGAASQRTLFIEGRLKWLGNAQ